MLKKYCSRILMLLFLVYTMSCTSGQQQDQQPAPMKLSASYQFVKTFMDSARLTEPGLVYFYTGKPKLPLPNAYCFDDQKNQLESNVHMFSEAEDYVIKLKGGLINVKKPGMTLENYLSEMPVVDAYDRPITASELSGYDYYLFLDFMALYDRGLMVSLANVWKATAGTSGKRIKLFLVHAYSAHNKRHFIGKGMGTNTDSTAKDREELKMVKHF